MLMYGNALAADMVVTNENIKIYNLTSLSERYANCRLPIMPPHDLGSSSEYEFDIKYMNWILNIDNNFIVFMTIILDLYNGIDVFLVISEDQWSEVITESLLKLIQQRYGIIAIQINSMEDLIYANDDSDFTDYGIINLDADKERYLYLYEQYRVINGLVNVDDEREDF